MSIGRRIRGLRFRQSLSLEELEELSGLDKNYLSRLEDGEEVPSYDELEKLRDALDVPLAQLFYGENEPVSTPRLTPRATLGELMAEDSRPPKSRPTLRETSTGLAGGLTGPQSALLRSRSRGATVDPADRSGSHWVRTRIGQVVLFWGALELVLRTQDALTKSDRLLRLQESLVSQLQFLADPRFAPLLMVVAFALIWVSNRPRKPAKLVLDQADQPQTKNYSIVGAAAIPLFLALVCGVSLTALKLRSPDHERLARLAEPGPIPNLPETLQRGVQPAAQKPGARRSDLSTGQSSGPQKTAPLVRSLPRLTPAIDQPSQDAKAVGNEGQMPINPSDLSARFQNDSRQQEPTVWKLRPSSSNVDAPHSNVDTPQAKPPVSIEQARNDNNWQLLAALCEDALRGNRRSLRLHLLAADAYANLGQIDRAIDELEYVKRQGAGDPNYRSAVERATKFRESIRQRYGR